MTLGQFEAAHIGRGRRRSWRRRAVVGAALLSCLTAAAAQAVSGPPPATPLASGPLSSGSAPIDARDLATTPAPAPSPDSFARGSSVSSKPPAGNGPGGTTVITEDTKQRIADVSGTTHYDIPQAALLAYKRAVIVMDETAPDCHLSWPVLAGIGQVESDQGRYGGAHVLSDGSTQPHIVGIALNGVGNVARIPDTDNGRWDSDKVWDRAVGPMQFIPSTWAVVGVDADNDGVRNPHDFDDAALAAAVYLCVNHRDLDTAEGLHAAIYSYNHSEAYVDTVLRLARAYANGDVAVVPNDGPPPVSSDDGTGTQQPPGGHHGHRPGGHHPDHPGQNPPPGGGSPGPPPAPDPDPGPPPPAPKPIVLTGFVAACEKDPTAWCLGDAQLDFGDNADLSQAQEDYDADGVVEPVVDELAGLGGTSVTVQLDSSHLVLEIQGLPYAIIEVAATDPTTTDPTTTDPTTTDPTTTDPTTTDPTATDPTATDPTATGE